MKKLMNGSKEIAVINIFMREICLCHNRIFKTGLSFGDVEADKIRQVYTSRQFKSGNVVLIPLEKNP